MSEVLPIHSPAHRIAGCLLAVCAAALTAQTPRLSDPERSMFRSFPSADGYRVIRRDIDAAARPKIEARLPFRVHFDDLGKHSLYVALRGRRPVGMIYVQHEASQFGLAAVEWALTFDLKISSFHFQRVRSPHHRALASSRFVRSMSGMTAADLAAKLNPRGELKQLPDGLAPGARPLASSVVRSGLKAIAVLDIVWRQEIDKLLDVATGLQHFPFAESSRRLWPRGPRKIASPGQHDEARLTYAIHVYGKNNRLLGSLGDSCIGTRTAPCVARWVLAPNRVITRVLLPANTPKHLAARCKSMIGKPLATAIERTDIVGQGLQQLAAAMRPIPAAKPGR